MTKEEIFEKMKGVLAVVRPSVNMDGINFDTLLVKDLALDSLSMLLMGLALEKEFDIRFDNNFGFETINDVCETLSGLLDAKNR